MINSPICLQRLPLPLGEGLLCGWVGDGMTSLPNTTETILADNDVSLVAASFTDANLRGVAINQCDITGLRIDGVEIAPLLAKHKEA